MRVLLAPHSYPPAIGGVQQATAQCAAALRRRGHEILVVTSDEGNGAVAEPDAAVPVRRLPFRAPGLTMLRDATRAVAGLGCTSKFAAGYPWTVHRLSRIACDFAPDVVNVHFVGDQALYFLPVLGRNGSPLVTSIHGAEIEQYPRQMAPRRWLLRLMLRRSDVVLSNSSHLLGEACRIEPDLDAKASVVGNGVGIPQFACSAPNVPDEPRIFAAGRFVEKKGFDVLLHALRCLKQRVPSAALTLAGDGPRLPQCQRLARSLGLADHVTFLGSTDHDAVLRHMHESSVVAVPSRQEPFGMVVLEAMVCGTPVVATRVGGIPDILTHMREGLLVESERPREMARAIERLLQDRPLSEAMGRQGRAKVLHRFTWDSVAKRYERAYDRALRRREALAKTTWRSRQMGS